MKPPPIIQVHPKGLSATVCTGRHTTQVVGIADAQKWVRFYQRQSKRPKSGHFYARTLEAFEEVLRLMLERSG